MFLNAITDGLLSCMMTAITHQLPLKSRPTLVWPHGTGAHAQMDGEGHWMAGSWNFTCNHAHRSLRGLLGSFQEPLHIRADTVPAGQQLQQLPQHKQPPVAQGPSHLPVRGPLHGRGSSRVSTRSHCYSLDTEQGPLILKPQIRAELQIRH